MINDKKIEMKKMVDLLKQRNANAPNPKFIFA